jgi:hypothetical protein
VMERGMEKRFDLLFIGYTALLEMMFGKNN